MNKIEILRFLSYSCVAGLFIYAWQIVGIKEINRKKLILTATLVVLATIFTILKNIEEKKAEQIASEKADQMYYEEMFSQPKMNLSARNPTIIIPAYDERFIDLHPERKKYFVRKVPAEQIFSTELNIFNSLMTNAQYQVIDKKKIIDEAIEIAKYMNKKSEDKLSCAQ